MSARFVHGSEFEDSFSTPAGTVHVLAEVHIQDTWLVLDNVLFFPQNSRTPLRVGVGQVVRIFRRLRTLAAENGFKQLTIVAHRSGFRPDGRPRPGTIISFTREVP